MNDLEGQDRMDRVAGAYDRLRTSLAAPPDAADRVARRIAVRRRRRVGAAVTGALVLTVGVGGLAVSAGGEGDDRAVDPATTSDGPASTLVYTRADGSTYAFPDVKVTCTSDPNDPERMRIFAASPQVFTDGEPEEPLFYAEAILEKVAGGRTLRLPIDRGSSEEQPLILFVADVGTRGDGNEVSSAQAGAAGEAVVVEASCGAVPRLSLKVDATLGSEVELPPGRLTGELRP